MAFHISRPAKKRRFLGASLAILFFGAIGPRVSLAEEQEQMGVPDDLIQRGRLFRIALDEAYHKLVKMASLRTRGGNDITELAVAYIPIGTSFDDAEIILQNAGFKVGQRPSSNPPGNRPDRHAVTASIVSFAQKFPSRTDVYVFLTPQIPGDYRGGVATISATIIMSFL